MAFNEAGEKCKDIVIRDLGAKSFWKSSVMGVAMPVSGVESELVEVLPEEVLLEEEDWLELEEASLEAEINVEEDDAEDEEGVWREEEAVESSSEESSSEDWIDDSLDGGSFREVADDAWEDWILDPAGPKEREQPVNARAQDMTSKGTRFIRLL